MTRLLPPLGGIATALLLVTVAIGYAASAGLAPPLRHVGLGIPATLLVLLYQSVCLFFLVGSPFRLRQVMREESLDEQPLADMPAVGRLLPLGVLALAAAMAAYILGGGAHTGALSPHLHGGLAVLALLSQAASTWQQRRALLRVESVIARVEEQYARRRGSGRR